MARQSPLTTTASRADMLEPTRRGDAVQGHFSAFEGESEDVGRGTVQQRLATAQCEIYGQTIASRPWASARLVKRDTGRGRHGGHDQHSTRSRWARPGTICWDVFKWPR